MATIEVIIRDDEGNIINQSVPKKYELNVGKGTVADIEGAVESFKNKALAEIEGELLKAEQTKFAEEQKNRKIQTKWKSSNNNKNSIWEVKL